MNLFTSTRFSLPEEDRLTAALLCVLEHTDRRLLGEFSNLCGAARDAGTAVHAEFAVQVPLPQSRPDSVIRLAGYDLIIEAKHSAPFDADQFSRHCQGLVASAEAFNSPVLVVLTGNRREKVAIRASIADAKAMGARAVAVDWRQVAQLVSAYADGPDTGEATRLLAAQFRDYLKDLGYCAPIQRQKATMKSLHEAAAAVRALRATAAATDDALAALRDALKQAPGCGGLRWQIETFRSLDFRFLDAQIRPGAPLRLRVVPYADHDGWFRVKFYLTFAPAAAPKCAEMLLAHRDELRDGFGSTLVCDTEPDGYFRVIDHLPGVVVEGIYAGDEEALSDAVEAIDRLFTRLRLIVDAAV